MRVKSEDSRYDSSGSLSDIPLGCYSDNEPDYLPAQGTQHSPVLPEEEQHHTLSTSPLKYLQISIDAMTVLAQKTELRPNTKAQETAEIDDDSSRAQEAASTPDSQNQRMHGSITIRAIHQLSYSFSFAAYLMIDSMSVNDTTDAICTDISHTASTSEHTPDSTILTSPDVELPTRSRKIKRDDANGKDSNRKRT